MDLAMEIPVIGAVRLSGDGKRARLNLQLTPPAAAAREDAANDEGKVDMKALFALVAGGEVAVHPLRHPVRKAALLIMANNIQAKLKLAKGKLDKGARA